MVIMFPDADEADGRIENVRESPRGGSEMRAEWGKLWPIMVAAWAAMIPQCTVVMAQQDTNIEPWPTGVVLEGVGKESALEKAGLRPGDVVWAWERLPNPPASPEADHGAIESVFDWMWLDVEQAPRGTVKLFGERDDVERIFEVEIGDWAWKAFLAALEDVGAPETGIAIWSAIGMSYLSHSSLDLAEDSFEMTLKILEANVQASLFTAQTKYNLGLVARSVLATLWSVPDRTTAELKSRFYRHVRSGKSWDEALRAAQLNLIGGDVENEWGAAASAPFYWAAFQVIGDWQ